MHDWNTWRDVFLMMRSLARMHFSNLKIIWGAPPYLVSPKNFFPIMFLKRKHKSKTKQICATEFSRLLYYGSWVTQTNVSIWWCYKACQRRHANTFHTHVSICDCLKHAKASCSIYYKQRLEKNYVTKKINRMFRFCVKCVAFPVEKEK